MNNTPKNSVFICLPGVHSPISDIGGRLRLLSYINWPYSHGFKSGEDNVFKRLSDIELFYNNINNEEVFRDIISKYKVNFVYFGPDEREKFPLAEGNLDRSLSVRMVYNSDNIKIYEYGKR